MDIIYFWSGYWLGICYVACAPIDWVWDQHRLHEIMSKEKWFHYFLFPSLFSFFLPLTSYILSLNYIPALWIILREDLVKLPMLDLNLEFSCLSLLGLWDHRCVSPYLAYIIFFLLMCIDLHFNWALCTISTQLSISRSDLVISVSLPSSVSCLAPCSLVAPHQIHSRLFWTLINVSVLHNTQTWSFYSV